MREVGLTVMRHVIVSVDPARFGEDLDQQETIRQVRGLALTHVKAHFYQRYGGFAVVHLWRNCYGGERGRWGPHTHLVTPGVDLTATATRGALEQGLTVEVVRERAPGIPFVAYVEGKLVRLLIYLLDHSCAVGNSPSVVPFGEVRGVMARLERARRERESR